MKYLISNGESYFTHEKGKNKVHDFLRTTNMNLNEIDNTKIFLELKYVLDVLFRLEYSSQKKFTNVTDLKISIYEREIENG